MAKGIEISRMTHAEIPENLYRRLVNIAKEMALSGDMGAAGWLLNEPRVLKNTITSSEFSRLKKDKNFRERYHNKPCAVCGKPSDTIDHIIPLSMGGSNEDNNLRPMCRSCNSIKSNTC